MQRLLPVLLFLAPALLRAQDGERAGVDFKKSPKDVSSISLLPNGSVLDGVMLPRYDRDRKLVEVMKAARMTIVDADQISGEKVTIEFFNPDQTSKGRVDMVAALFNQKTGILRANETVDITSDRVIARGAGLYYSLKDGKGFLPGPAMTRILPPPATAMHLPSPLRATALLGVSMLPLIAAPPPVAAPAAQEVESMAPAAQAANQQTRQDLRADLDRSAAATRDVEKFLEQAELVSNQPAEAPPAAVLKPMDVTPGPADTLVNCEGGMYFDSEAGVLVYLRNVKVADPRFDLSGASEVKVFFEKKPVEPAKKPADPAKEKSGTTLGGGSFGNVEKIVATGAVRVLQKSTEKGKDPIEASGALLTYNVKTGDIVISGGYPWVKQGAYFSRAKQPNLTLSITRAGSFSTEGSWEMGAPLNLKR